jgi:hypothetical protein
MHSADKRSTRDTSRLIAYHESVRRTGLEAVKDAKRKADRKARMQAYIKPTDGKLVRLLKWIDGPP